MRKNNFKELENLMISQRKSDGEYTKNSIGHQTGLFRLVGDIIDLFFPRMIDTLIGNPRSSSKYPNREE